MTNPIPYKSFCWSLGTTSFRTKNFNKTIEEQLTLLNEFWSLAENQGIEWSGNKELQTRYYDFMRSKGFVEGDAKNKPKDAREKTSGLVDIGLIDAGRRLTNAGNALLRICSLNIFEEPNSFNIPADSYVYLRQLLKTHYYIDGKCVRPFIVLLYLLAKLDYLTLEEYTYLLPLCVDRESTEEIIDGIQRIRHGEKSVDDIIISKLMSMTNYQVALKIFLNTSKVDDLIMCYVGLNRKSREYDKAYYELYRELRLVYLGNYLPALPLLYEAARKINIGKYWIKYIFNTSSRSKINNSPSECKKHTVFDEVSGEEELKEAFFKTMHLFKAKATLSDYLDLNRRYIKTTDIVLFEDDTVKLDIVPKFFFKSVITELYADAFSPSELLFEDCSLEEISECLRIDNNALIDGINEELGINADTLEEAMNALEDERYRRLQHLIDTKFTDTKIISLLEHFEARNDAEIRNLVTDNADIPTIFEYVLGILWYKVSERQGKILDYMKLSLDADLLPKTHAAGGEADIVYEYPETNIYPEHSLLLEATLSDGTNQRRMEMEPVSRHLGQHLIRTENANSYCVFATNYLHINVISDFRVRKITPYYDPQDYSRYVNGMKIIPLQISALKRIVEKRIKYRDLYPLFEDAFNSFLPPHEWYGICIEERL